MKVALPSVFETIDPKVARSVIDAAIVRNNHMGARTPEFQSALEKFGLDRPMVWAATQHMGAGRLHLVTGGLTAGLYFLNSKLTQAALYCPPTPRKIETADFDFAISYALKDLPVARYMAQQLTMKGFSTYLIDVETAPEDELWAIRYKAALENSRYFILLVSEDYAVRSASRDESEEMVLAAVLRSDQQHWFRVLPVLINQAQNLLANRKMIAQLPGWVAPSKAALASVFEDLSRIARGETPCIWQDLSQSTCAPDTKKLQPISLSDGTLRFTEIAERLLPLWVQERSKQSYVPDLTTKVSHGRSTGDLLYFEANNLFSSGFYQAALVRYATLFPTREQSMYWRMAECFEQLGMHALALALDIEVIRSKFCGNDSGFVDRHREQIFRSNGSLNLNNLAKIVIPKMTAWGVKSFREKLCQRILKNAGLEPLIDKTDPRQVVSFWSAAFDGTVPGDEDVAVAIQHFCDDGFDDAFTRLPHIESCTSDLVLQSRCRMWAGAYVEAFDLAFAYADLFPEDTANQATLEECITHLI